MFHNGVGETEDMGTRPLAHAGRRSAGLGGDGRARPGAHAVGVWVHGEWAIWSGVGHWRLLLVLKYICFMRPVPRPIIKSIIQNRNGNLVIYSILFTRPFIIGVLRPWIIMVYAYMGQIFIIFFGTHQYY